MRHVDAMPRRIHHPTVVDAHDLVADDLAHGQRRLAVRTAVLQGDQFVPDLAVRNITIGRSQMTCSMGCVDTSVARAEQYHLFG